MFQRTLSIAAIMGLLAWGANLFADAPARKTLRVYFVGNSVTDSIKYGALAELAKSRGYTQVWGRHMIPGAPLQWIWQHPKDGFQEPPFGHYPTALANFQWDILSLQPFDRHLDGKDGDIVMAKNFIDLALPKSPDLQIYVYARWPRQQKDDFDTAWLKKYTGGWDNTNETKNYFERLAMELRKEYPKLKKPILMVPVGHVMYELNQWMKAGKVPGYTDIKQLFADGIHLNNVGSYVVGCTFFATLYKQNPKGLPSVPYKVEDAKLAEIIQEVVWKVVSTHELAGVKAAGGNETLSDQEKTIALEIVRLGSSNKSECAAALKALIKIGKPAYTGEWVTWYVNGQKANQIQYRNVKYDGRYTAFHDDGSKRFQRHYKSGVFYGTELGWHRNGEQAYEGRYEHGEQVGTWWFENDQIEDVQEYKAEERVEESSTMNSLLLPEVQNILERLHALADARDETIIQQVRGNEAAWNAATSEQKAAM